MDLDLWTLRPKYNTAVPKHRTASCPPHGVGKEAARSYIDLSVEKSETNPQFPSIHIIDWCLGTVAVCITRVNCWNVISVFSVHANCCIVLVIGQTIGLLRHVTQLSNGLALLDT